jgi:hypothetical protein
VEALVRHQRQVRAVLPEEYHLLSGQRPLNRRQPEALPGLPVRPELLVLLER